MILECWGSNSRPHTRWAYALPLSYNLAQYGAWISSHPQASSWFTNCPFQWTWGSQATYSDLFLELGGALPGDSTGGCAVSALKSLFPIHNVLLLAQSRKHTQSCLFHPSVLCRITPGMQVRKMRPPPHFSFSRRIRPMAKRPEPLKLLYFYSLQSHLHWVHKAVKEVSSGWVSTPAVAMLCPDPYTQLLMRFSFKRNSQAGVSHLQSQHSGWLKQGITNSSKK